MITQIGKHKSKIAKLIAFTFVGALALGFLMQGVQPNQGPKYVAKVLGQPITPAQHYRLIETISSTIRNMHGPQYLQLLESRGVDFRKMALDELVGKILKESFMNHLGLSIGIEQIENHIRGLPAFAGGYSQAAYRSYLDAARLSGVQLEEQTKKQLLDEQFSNIVRQLTAPSDVEVRGIVAKEDTKYSLNAVKWSAAEFAAKVPPADDETLKAHYEKLGERYREPEKVRFYFVEFAPQEFEGTLTVDEQDLRDEYEAIADRFLTEASYQVREISLSKITDDKTKKALGAMLGVEGESKESSLTPMQRAEAMLERLKKGDEFEMVAREAGDGSTAPSDIAKRLSITLPEIPESQREKVSSLAPGEFSQVVEFADKLSIFLLEEIKEPTPRPFEEVKGEVEKLYRAANAPAYMLAAARQFESQVGDKIREMSPEEAAKSFPQAVAGFGRSAQGGDALYSETATPVPSVPDLTARLLAYNPGDVTLVEGETSAYVAYVVEKKDSAIPTFEDVKEAVRTDYVNQEAAAAAAKHGEELLVALGVEKPVMAPVKGATPLAQVAKARGLKVIEERDALIREPKGEVVRLADVRAKLSSMSSEKPLLGGVVRNGNDFYLVELAAATPPSPEEVKKGIKERGEQIRNMAAQRTQGALIAVLRKEALDKGELEINPEALIGTP